MLFLCDLHNRQSPYSALYETNNTLLNIYLLSSVVTSTGRFRTDGQVIGQLQDDVRVLEETRKDDRDVVYIFNVNNCIYSVST